MISLPIRRVRLNPHPRYCQTPTWMILHDSLGLMLTRGAIASPQATNRIIGYYGSQLPRPARNLSESAYLEHCPRLRKFAKTVRLLNFCLRRTALITRTGLARLELPRRREAQPSGQRLARRPRRVRS